jgi:multicomponent Na+:H+ antiporter subunit D
MQGLCYAGTMLTFYLFYEMMTLMSLPLVIHERTPKAMHAGFIYLGYSLFGAALALFGFFILSAHTNTLAFMAGGIPALAGMSGEPWFLWVAIAVFIGFGTKAGLMPMHFWLPTAHPVAPAPASAVLSGCITKAGVLGILRMAFYVFGADNLRGTWVQLVMLILTLVTIFGGSMLAFMEQDLKKRLAWSTVSQASYVLYGLFLFNRTAFTGAILQSVFHAVAKVLLFLCAGAFICKTGKRRVSDLTGMGRQMPVTCFCFGIAGLSLVGIPPFAGFVSKWYLAEGSLAALPWGWVGAAVLLISALLTAGYLLVPVSRMFFPGKEVATDARIWAGGFLIVPLIMLAVAALLLGLFPAGLQDLAEWISHSVVL